MKNAFYAFAIALAAATAANAANVEYTFEDSDGDEIFNVSVAVTGGSNGLATYNVALSGLDASPLDPTAFTWTEAFLSNLGDDFVTRGFTGGLLASNVGTDGYSATNTQFQQTPLFGVGINPVMQAGAGVGPIGGDISLDVPAVIGTLQLPGANGLSDADLLALLSPNAALFTGTDAAVVENPDAVSSTVVRDPVIPEPSTILLGSLALVGFAARRR